MITPISDYDYAYQQLFKTNSLADTYFFFTENPKVPSRSPRA